VARRRNVNATRYRQKGTLYKSAAKARPAAPSMKGAAVCIAPESPDEVPDSDSSLELEPESSLELEPEPEPEPVVAASDAVEAAEPPADAADWLASEPRELPEAASEAELRKLETAERLADAPALDAAATPELVPLVGMGIIPEPPGK